MLETSNFFQEIEKLKSISYFFPINIHSANFIYKISKSNELFLSVALLSKLERDSQICIDLKEWSEKKLTEKLFCPKYDDWIEALKNTTVISIDEVSIPIIADTKRNDYKSRQTYKKEFKPLVLSGTKLYFARYFQYFNTLNSFIQKNQKKNYTLTSDIKKSIDSIQDVSQRNAILKSLTSKFSVISGAPGTGKTYTVSKIISLFLEQQPSIKIAISAPTGKASAKLQSSITNFFSSSFFSSLKKNSFKISTIHRLLGFQKTNFNFNKYNKLKYDLVIVDEISMVDLPLMAKLIDALKDDARLILLGDINQLSSVEPGAVLKNISKNEESFLSILKTNYRFSKTSGIWQVADLICKNESIEEVLKLIKSGSFKDVKFKQFENEKELHSFLIDEAKKKFNDAISEKNPQKLISIFERFKILSPIKRSTVGIEAINIAIERELFFDFKPIMINKNIHKMLLFNGDIGIYDKKRNRFFFLNSNSEIREIESLDNNVYEDAFAITIHKSQGSEFDSVSIVLPDKKQLSFLSKEMLYTAISRAKKEVCIIKKD